MQWLFDDYWKSLQEGAVCIQAMGSSTDSSVTQTPSGVASLEGDAVDDDLAERAVMSDSVQLAGGWEKWQGRWDPKPIGMV